jgi:hypothetical protein
LIISEAFLKRIKWERRKKSDNDKKDKSLLSG